MFLHDHIDEVVNRCYFRNVSEANTIGFIGADRFHPGQALRS